MASIHKQAGRQNWFVAFYDPEGFRRFRSTGTTQAKIARTICATIEHASELARLGKLSNEKALRLVRQACEGIRETHGNLAADQAQKVLSETTGEFIAVMGGELVSYTVRSWLSHFVEGRTDVSKATLIEYRRTNKLFLDFLGTRADLPLTTLQPKQVEDFKSELIKRVSPSSVNKSIKILKACFNNAVSKRQLDFNPAEHVSAVNEGETTRRPFTDAELKGILRVLSDEQVKGVNSADWKTMVLLGFYTGLRLRDCANLTWEKVQLHTGVINLGTQKTGRRQDIPMAEPLARHLSKLAGDDPAAPLCPTLAGREPSVLSAEFYQVMVAAGVAKKRGHQKTGQGRDGRRDVGRVSFHSLRYNTTSALKSGGVSDSVAMDIVGHETASISRNYTKIDDAAKRAAVAKLPDITSL